MEVGGQNSRINIAMRIRKGKPIDDTIQKGRANNLKRLWYWCRSFFFVNVLIGVHHSSNRTHKTILSFKKKNFPAVRINIAFQILTGTCPVPPKRDRRGQAVQY